MTSEKALVVALKLLEQFDVIEKLRSFDDGELKTLSRKTNIPRKELEKFANQHAARKECVNFQNDKRQTLTTRANLKKISRARSRPTSR